MLSRFQSTWNGHRGRISVAMHCIELLQPDIGPANSASYRAGSKAREIEKAKVDNIIAENIIEPVQME